MRSVLTTLLLALLIPTTAQSRSPDTLFVSLPPVQYFAERVVGDTTPVRSMMMAGQDPHTFEPTPKQMASLGGCRLYFAVGVPFETAWLPKLARSHPAMKIVDLRQGLPHDDQTGHHDDPHLWTSPPLARIMVETIRREVTALDPTHAKAYADNAARFDAELAALDTTIRQTLATARQKTFMVYHPAWGAFADTYGLTQIAIEHEGKRPGPKGLARLIDRAKREGLRTIFIQKEYDRRLADGIAKETGATVVIVDPLAHDYLSAMNETVAAFAKEVR